MKVLTIQHHDEDDGDDVITITLNDDGTIEMDVFDGGVMWDNKESFLKFVHSLTPLVADVA